MDPSLGQAPPGAHSHAPEEQIPVYYFPIEDVESDILAPSHRSTHCPFKGDATYRSIMVGRRRAENAMWMYETPLEGAAFLSGMAAFYFHSLDAWFEEDEEIFVHARDPYVRIDILASSRHVRVSVEGQIVAESDRAHMLFETSLPTRYYLPKEDVRMDLLEVSGLVTECAYKGRPSHFSLRGSGAAGEHVAWCYESPHPEALKVQGKIAFYNEKVQIEVDGREVAS